MIFVWPLIFVFVLLDLSTAFNTVDLDFFLQPLEHTIDIKAITLQWFELYLRLKFVHANGESFSCAKVHYGVPQGSVLEPVLFTLYRQYEGEIYIFTSMQMIPRFHPWSQMTHTTLYPSPEWRQYFWFGLQGNLKCIIPLRINGLLLCQQLIIAVIFKRKKMRVHRVLHCKDCILFFPHTTTVLNLILALGWRFSASFFESYMKLNTN